MAYESNAFHRRMRRFEVKKDKKLGELLRTLCPTDGVPADPSTGQCRVCHRTVFVVEHDPIPTGTQIPLDEEKAHALRESTPG